MTRPNKRFQALLLPFVLLSLGSFQQAGATSRPLPLTSEDNDENCTRTVGYWKNHSAHASNPSQNIPWPISEETLLCGETWFDILHTPPQGRAWFILAHQWIAAELNAASGADTQVLGDALDDAGDLLANNCGGIPDDLRDEATDLASLLEDFNTGRTGPGHCGDITDCNGNGIDDSTDIDDGTSPDANRNGVPDECEPEIVEFCEGDGADNGGADCPCLNNAPQGTTAGCLNRDGVGAQLTGSGVPSVSNDTLLLTVTGIPNGAPGFFFQGAANAGFNPFFNGLRCIGGPFVRMAKIAGFPGGVTLPLPGDPPISVQFNIPAGATRYYQVLYRDGNNPLCPNSANASNAVRVVWGL